MNELITLAIVVILIGLSFLVVYIIKKESVKYNDENLLRTKKLVTYPTFISVIERKISKSKKMDNMFSVILVDIDKFNEVSEKYNHLEEETFIKSVLKNIRNVLPEEYILSPGAKKDQLYILIPSSYNQSYVLSLANKIKEAAETNISIIETVVIKKTVSVAVATFPLHGTKFELLLQALDIALYMVKKSGGNAVKYYTEDLNKSKEKLDLYFELKEAITKEEFIYHYQPIVSSTNIAEVYGVEALLRWNHPKRGLLPPSDFLQVAEQTGEIDLIALIGVEQALLFINSLQQQYSIHNLVVNINVSPRQFLNENTFTVFQRLIQKHRTPVDLVTIEIPEFSVYKHNNTFIKTITKIKSLGFKVAIDIDITDYDVMDLVEKFEIDMIKLNKDFFKLDNNYNFRKYLKMIVDFAKEKNILLVAEGIEDQEALNDCINNGIEYVQGYFISKPVDHNIMIEYLLKK